MSVSKTSDKESKDYGINDYGLTYKVKRGEEVQMAASNGKMAASNGIPISKTLDSIASLPRDEKPSDNEELDFKKSGVLLMAKSDAEGGNGDLLFAGTLSLLKKPPWNIPTIEWIPQSDQNGGEDQINGMYLIHLIYLVDVSCKIA